MKKLIIIIIAIIVLTGCTISNNLPEPFEVIRTEVNIIEVEELMLNAWKPALDMTIDGITIPRTKVKSFEEFLESYDFSYIDEYFVEDVYFRSMATYDSNSEMVLDEEGHFVFDPKNHSTYIPTIYNEEVEIVEAFYEEIIYEDEYSQESEVFLKIKEGVSGNFDNGRTEHHRTSIFKKNEDEKWILTHIEGVLGYLPGTW